METTTIDYSWQAGAECSSLTPALFYPNHGKNVSQVAVDACANCPVRSKCLDHALTYEEYGYWASTTPRQRVSMRKELGIKVIRIEYESEANMAEEISKHQDFINDHKIKGRGRKAAQCGTRSGYNAHLRRKKSDPSEEICDDCHRAHSHAMIAFKNNKKVKA